MVDFKTLSENCKWRRSKVCKAIENYCEVDNCALYQMLEAKEARHKEPIVVGNVTEVKETETIGAD